MTRSADRSLPAADPVCVGPPRARTAQSDPNRVVRWFDRGAGHTEFLSARYTDFAFPPHFHETYAIGIIDSGGQRFRPRREAALVMPAGTLCVIEPGVVHEGRSATGEGWAYRMFYPSVREVARALECPTPAADDGFARFHRHVIDDAALYREFARMHASSAAAESLLERDTRARLFLQALFARHARVRGTSDAGAKEPRAVEQVREYLHAHWDRAVRAADLGQLVGLSQTHVIRSFARCVGMPPHAYQQALRVERAQSFIRAGYGLAQTASAAAFYDQSQMTRHFRKIVGVTPGRYARGSAPVSGTAKTSG